MPAKIDSLEKRGHGQIGPVKGRYVVIVEGKLGSSGGNLLAIFHQLFDATDFREGRCHGSDTPCPYLLSMLGQPFTLFHAATAHVHNHLESGGSYSHPLFGQTHAFLLGKHVTLARRSVDKHTFQPVFHQHAGIRLDRCQIHLSLLVERCKRSIDQSYYLFHIRYI